MAGEILEHSQPVRSAKFTSRIEQERYRTVLLFEFIQTFEFITARKRSFRKGNVFTHVCQSVRGGACVGGGACVIGGGMRGRGHAWQGTCVAGGGGHAWLGGRCAWRGGMRDRRDDHCSGRYASYWNAFLLYVILM